MLLALASGAWLLRKSQRDLSLPSGHRIAIGISAFCGAMLGAKLPFVLSDWPGLLSGAAWFSSGKTILCGMVAAYFSVELAKWALEIKTKTGDSFAVPVAVSVAIGRLGCLTAGCCYGIPTNLPWGMRCAIVDDLVRHPTQLYEFVFHASMAVLMTMLIRRNIWKGQIVKLYILSYLVYRIATETIRPEARYSFGLTAYQWFALAMIPVFVYLWYRDSQSAALARLTSVEEQVDPIP